MEVIIIMVVSFVGYIVAYNTYGRFLAARIFKVDPQARVPSREFEDGVDFVPTRKGIIFGHHYTSIAGTGPIVGPAIGVIWGWVPALIWIFVGAVVMGAVHDFGAVLISMRNRGLSISECAARYVSPRVKYIFYIIIFILLLLVIAVFGIVIAAIFKMFPGSVIPVWFQIPIAVGLGWAIYKKGANVTLATAIAVFLMFLTIVAGNYLPIEMPSAGPLPPTGLWVVLLLIYAFVASTLPVTTLLQPRDYINAWQLFLVMGLMVTGVLSSGFQGQVELVAPAFVPDPDGSHPWAPFLFITIACGAISGFHSLVASGTTSKQVASEKDALFVGYGSMLLESALALLVLLAVAAGIGMEYNTGESVLTGVAAWKHHYSSWAASSGLASNLNAMVVGSSNMIESFGIPKLFAIIVMGVFVASFAGTTLDTATRIQRYIVSELFSGTRLRILTGRYPATLFAVLTAAGLAFATGADGMGAKALWPLFGVGNQLLAALALLLLTNYLMRSRGLRFLVTGIPAIFMLVITFWALLENEKTYLDGKQWLLAGMNVVIFLLAIWIVVEGTWSLRKAWKEGRGSALEP